MNSIWILILAGIWLLLGYRFYGGFIEGRFKINDKTITPAKKFNTDKTDFSPAKKPFLIGQHFSAIAGAGPIIGPILAVSYFGWLPVVLWASLGSLFIGAMHDYTILMVSVRNKAKGISNIAKSYLNTKTGWIFGFILWITLLLIITAFTVSSAESLILMPELIIPIFGLSLVALFMGVISKKLKINYIVSSFIGLIFVFMLLYIGYLFPIDLTIYLENKNFIRIIWISVILCYAGVVSVLPIKILMRPRDYLGFLQMIVILFIGIISLLIVRPEINAPAYISGSPMPLWPILFITVACGAISGFHGIIASGTTSKQLAKESHGKPVAFGSMLLEGFLAITVAVFVASGLKWGSSALEGSFQQVLSTGWINLFSISYASIVSSASIPLIGMQAAILMAGLMVNQFILTSVDSSARLGRMIVTENLFPKIKSKFLAIILILIPAWILAVTSSYEKLWQLFGSSNQLIAAISLLTISTYLLAKKTKTRFIFIPSIFVLITTLTALVYLLFNQTTGFFLTGNYLLAGVTASLFILGIVVAYESLKNFKTMKKMMS